MSAQGVMLCNACTSRSENSFYSKSEVLNSFFLLKKWSGITEYNFCRTSGTQYLYLITAMNLYIENSNNQNIVRWLKRRSNFQLISCHYRMLDSQGTVFPISHFILFLSKFNAVISFKMCSTFCFSEIGHVLIIAFVFRCVTS